MLKKCNVCGEISEHKSWKSTTCNVCLSKGIKACNCCGKVLPITEFHTLYGKPTGVCKACDNRRSVRSKQKTGAAQRLSYKAYQKEYYQLDSVKEARAARCRERYYTDPEYRAYVRLRDNKRRNANDLGNLTQKEWHSTCEAFKFTCAYCGCENDITLDHVIPVSAGGITSIENVLPACGHCNRSKGAKDMISWYTAQPFYSKERLESIIRYLKSKKGSDAE